MTTLPFVLPDILGLVDSPTGTIIALTGSTPSLGLAIGPITGTVALSGGTPVVTGGTQGPTPQSGVFSIVAGWCDASISGTVNLVGYGDTIIAPVVNGELRYNGRQGISLNANHDWVMFFNLSHGGFPVFVYPIAIPACSPNTINDVGGMTGNAHMHRS